MNLIIFVPSKNKNTRRLFDAIEELELDVGLELHQSDGSLIRRLCQPAREIVAGVLVATRREDFDRIFFLREALEDIPLIIVLPCDNDDLVPRAHLMRPRFVSFWDQSLQEVPVVLARMLRHNTGIDAERSRRSIPVRRQIVKGARWNRQRGGLLS